jgi:predicted transport protein
VRHELQRLVVYVKLNPEQVDFDPGFIRDVRAVGHIGAGGPEIVITSDEDIERAKHLLMCSNEAS